MDTDDNADIANDPQIEAVEALAEQIESLWSSIDELSTLVRTLTDTLKQVITATDDLATEMHWRNTEARHQLPAPAPLTSMPVDAAALDWKINRVAPADLPSDAMATGSRHRATLFD